VLKPDIAKQRLEQWQIQDPDDRDDDDITRFAEALKRLPARLSRVGLGLFGLNEKGTRPRWSDNDSPEIRKKAAFADLDRLSAKDRLQILRIPFPKLVTEVNRTWESLRGAPYSTRWNRLAFRAPHRPEASVEWRREWLERLLEVADVYQEAVLTPAWLATWAPFLDIGYSDCQREAGCLLAGVIDAGGPDAEVVFDILCQSARNEHEIGGMGRHVTQALLLSSRVEGWELIEKLLLAAKRQEGLRQAILETVDLTHPEAFRRFLNVILEHDLIRFSAVARAADVWFGLLEGASSKVLLDSIQHARAFLEKPASRAGALKGSDPVAAYFALWATAFEDAEAAIPLAARLLDSKSAEMRFVGCKLLREIGLPESRRELQRCLDDEDLRIVRLALFGGDEEDDDEDLDAETAASPERFEQIERLYARLPEKPKKLPGLVWSWTSTQLGRNDVLPVLMGALGKLPPTRLLPYLSGFDPWDRRSIIELFEKQKKWSPEAREAILGLIGDPSADVREAAFAAVEKLTLTDDEFQRIEGYLTRKSSDLRHGILSRMLAARDSQALDCADRLLAGRDANQRLAGLELARQLFEQDRQIDACRKRVEAYREARGKLSKEELNHVSAVLDVSPGTRSLTLENALGFMDPGQRPPVVAPRARKVAAYTDNSIALLKALDDLVHKHREQPIVVNTKTGEKKLLGTVRWEFPSCNVSRPPEQEAKKLPLRDVWEEWWASRPKSLRDPDQREFWRAEDFFESHDDWEFPGIAKWAKKDRPGVFALLKMDARLPKLKYEAIVTDLLGWMNFLHPMPGEIDFHLDLLETLLAQIPEADLKALVPAAADKKKRRSSDDDDDEQEDWRSFSVIEQWIRPLEVKKDQCTDAQFQRLWNLLHWLNQPVPGAVPRHPSWPILRRAYQAGLANLHEIAAHLVGPRCRSYGSDDGFDLLSLLTRRKQSPDDERFLEAHPEVRDLVRKVRDLIVGIELQRGDSPSVVTVAAADLSSLEGTDLLIQLLTALQKTGFKMARSYSDAPKSRPQSLTYLASITYPSSDESPEQSAAKLRAAVDSGAVSEERLIELAFLAPQWVRIVEMCFQWNGMAEALYWFLAHMNSWGSSAEDRAAEAEGFDEEDSADDDDEDEDEVGEDESTFDKPRKLSPWERLIFERTSLTEEERSDGAIDVAWFRRVYAEIGADRWKQLAQGARFAANASQARKAQLLADVLLGQASLEELIQSIRKKFLKESVRLLGLFPLPEGTSKNAELKRRFDVLAEYGRYARTLSGLTKPEALRSLQIGLQNLAGTAGYPDPIRLEWALGADAVRDLASGPVQVTKEGVTVSLQLDEQTQPVITVVRGDKPLKSAPPAVKKDKAVTELYERARDLKRQTSRQRQTLEGMMCRGDVLTGLEVATLCEHPLVAPFLERLILVGEGILGYPVRQGKALRNHAGKLEPIKKTEQLRLAHPYDLYKTGAWDQWQHECFHAERVQPFKQVFRELYLVTKQEKSDGGRSHRYAGQQVNPRQAFALWGQRGWKTDEGVFKTFHDEGIVASVDFDFGYSTPGEVEGPTIRSIEFVARGDGKIVPLAKVPPRLFSEVMRDMDLVVSVAHAGGVDPEATASTVEMRANLLRETCQLLSLKNVRFKANQAVIDGTLGQYSVHLGSGTVHRLPGGAVCIVPVHSQHRGRLFLPFADDDPRTAEVMSKVLMLARDQEIQDPSILDQLRA